jgi:hypothetical protein
MTDRHEVLNAYAFESFDQLRDINGQWMQEYHEASR